MKLKQKKYWIEHYSDKKYEDIRNLILNSFKGIEFIEETHQYFVNGIELECVSNITHRFKEHFDTDLIAQRTFERNFNNKMSKYYGMTVEEIKESWKEKSNNACSIGTMRHEFAESCFYFMVGLYDMILPSFKNRMKRDDSTGELYFESFYPKEDAVVKVYQDFPDYMIPILSEAKVFNINSDYSYCGTFDILFYLENPNGGPSGLYVLDWKTNEDLHKHFPGKKLLYPFNELDETSFNLYKLQLSAYQLALERIGLKVLRRALFWLKPNGEYEKLKLEDLSKQLHKALVETKNF